jgi:transposase-like protein
MAAASSAASAPSGVLDFHTLTADRILTREEIIWLGSQHLLAVPKPCPRCARPMALTAAAEKADKWRLRCRNDDVSCSIRSGSFFALHSKIPIPKILVLLRGLWLNYTQRALALEHGLNRVTLSLFHSTLLPYFRAYTAANPPIFPPGDHVEIDETHIRWRQIIDASDAEAALEGTWVFGMISRISGAVYFEPILDRTRLELYHVIRRKIQPGATIYSDALKSYITLNGLGYTHFVINKAQDGFARIDEATGALVHVNNIENQWRQFRAMINVHGGHAAQRLEDALHEYSFRRANRSFIDLIRMP